MNEQEKWQAVLARDNGFDGMFVYAVGSTGIYCRPSCPSRRPRREMVRFFDRPTQAEDAGFRACLRCHPDQTERPEPNLALMQAVCRYIDENPEHPPTLDDLAQRFHLSPYHLQRTFKRIIGVTPKQYAAAQRSQRLRTALKSGNTTTEAIYDAGYGSSSSAYAEAGTHLGMTPDRFRSGGADEAINYTITPSPLGMLLVAATETGICAVRLGDSEADLEATLVEEFPAATRVRGGRRLQQWIAPIADYLGGARPHLDLPLDIQATAFQRQVWTALQAIPYGSTRSYSEVATAIGRPTAARAVANACASNPAALVIPCHRVVREDGGLGGYRWGIQRKEMLLAQEAAKVKRER
ncbi:MAG: bifunctional DNA-binding transcriptional regulator/O6-methylguanine-DNA methyltransferase Ada [Anaerolineae bacterium]|nr:bifunctional DNA-binding transcriptional regulator/O6-methylguanine-DNA methyltransferase Ada [Anaerolineae bacterium]